MLAAVLLQVGCQAPETEGDDPGPCAAVEGCDALDNDCDGRVDEGLYLDSDQDGWGAGDCVPGEPAVERGGDCADTDAQIHPEQADHCDLVDEDCDGLVDEDFPGPLPTPYALDQDGDGFGDINNPSERCLPGEGYAPGTDCDDSDPSVFPEAEELCDGIDQDCDSVVDEGASLETWGDADGDGFGSPSSPGLECPAPSGNVDNALDCDDGDAEHFPGAVEDCFDGQDDDCDGLMDCEDADCAAACGERSCSDGKDDDLDGYVDCDDEDCWFGPSCAVQAEVFGTNAGGSWTGREGWGLFTGSFVASYHRVNSPSGSVLLHAANGDTARCGWSASNFDHSFRQASGGSNFQTTSRFRAQVSSACPAPSAFFLPRLERGSGRGLYTSSGGLWYSPHGSVQTQVKTTYSGGSWTSSYLYWQSTRYTISPASFLGGGTYTWTP